MKTSFFAFSILLFTIGANAQNKNYTVKIGDKEVGINLDEEVQIELPNGDSTTVEISQAAELSYESQMVSFKYPSNVSVSDTEIDDDITQSTVLNANGSGYLIQQYYTFDPSMLIDLMLNEITKESVSYGYKMKKEKFSKKLSSGEELEGTTATLTYKGEQEEYTVAAYSGKDEGILIVTMLLDQETKDEDEEMIDLFIDSLRIKN